MLEEVDVVQGLGELGDAAGLELVVDMEAPLIVQHLVHGLVETALERLHGAKVLEVRMSRYVPLGQLL